MKISILIYSCRQCAMWSAVELLQSTISCMQFNLHVYVIKWFWYNSTNMSRRFVPLKNIQTALAIQLFNISNGSHYNLVTSKFGNYVSFVKSLRNDLSQTFYTNVMQLFPPAHYELYYRPILPLLWRPTHFRQTFQKAKLLPRFIYLAYSKYHAAGKRDS